MKNIIKPILLLFFSSILLLGCNKDLDEKITSVDFSRLFSPTNLTAVVVNKTSVRLTWVKVNKADSYVIEIFDNGDLNFSGTPVKTIEKVNPDEIPYTITGLAGETNFSVRLKAKGTSVEDSKWSGATFKTDAEQIFRPVDLNEITANQVILRWPAGETATQIVLQPGNIIHTVTATEIAAGAATIKGLTPETNYTAKLMKNTSTRGTITFTTLIDLGGAIRVDPTDDLATILSTANAGDIFALMPGTYNTQDIVISKSISIKGARPANKPVLMGTIFRLADGAGLELKDLILDGTGSKDGNQMIIYDADLATPYAPFKMEDCTIRNYVKGLYYVNKKALIQSVLFKGNIIFNIECNGGDFIDFRTGLATTFDFINNTVYNSALARDFFRMDAGGSTNFPGIKSVITINNNTFNNICNGSSRRVLYIRLSSHEITFNKNILSNTDGYYTNQAATTIKEMSKNNYFNAPNFTGSTVSGSKNDTGDFTKLDPGYANPGAGIFTVSNIDLKSAGVGDPRWLQ